MYWNDRLKTFERCLDSCNSTNLGCKICMIWIYFTVGKDKTDFY